jgi:LysR substrate binding domain-containing protein
MRRGHRLSLEQSVKLEQFRGDRFVVPAEDLSPGFNRRLRALCSEHGFEPATSVASVIWDDEWPAGDDVVTLVNDGWARHVPERLRRVTLEPELRLPVELVWRQDDDSPVLKTFLDATS